VQQFDWQRHNVSKRIVLTTWGSFGDLHPFLALALELKRRGHRPRVVTCGLYREKVEGEGIEFAELRPDVVDLLTKPELVRRLFDPSRGSEFVLRYMAAALREQWADVEQSAADSDLIVSHSVTFATHLFAEWKKIPWISVALQPCMFSSRYDMPRLRQFKLLWHAPIWVRQAAYAAGLAWTRRWFGEYDSLRAEIGLPATAKHPFVELQFSRRGTLALFSPLLAAPQPDWPDNVTVTGFPFFDRHDVSSSSLSASAEAFLARGEPPLAFTSGSSSVLEPDNFFEVSLRVARALGRRAVLLAGRGHENRLALPDGDDFLVSAYEPHSQLFPRAAAVVHQGGIGTTGQALRSGVPQLVAAVSHDQPDNGDRVRRLGAGLWMAREQYQFERAKEAIARLLRDVAMRANAQRVGEVVRKETGATVACDVIERQFGL
jgi:UDP:flavonoid glycosyltransferase YjiC (YdhE family)